MRRSQDSCITPTNTTAALRLVWQLPRVSRGFKKGENMLERAVFHLLFSEGEVLLIWSPPCCPCEHLWQHRVPWVQHAGPRASAAAGELHPLLIIPISVHSTSPARQQPAPGPSLAGISALQSNVAWLSSLCKSPEKEEENWEELLAWILTAFPAFCTHHHFQEALGGAWQVHP